MARQQLTIRRPLPSDTSLDEPSWPVHLLLMVLASFVAGVIVARGDFETKNFFRSATIQLWVVGWLCLLLQFAFVFLGRVVQRRIQLAVLISLVVHLGICWGMREYQLPVVGRELVSKLEPTAPPVTLPDYHVRTAAEHVDTDQKEEFEKPLATAVPDTDAPQIKRQAASARQPRATKKEAPALAALTPKPIDVARAEVSAPRRAENLRGPERSRQKSARVPADERVPLAKLRTGENKRPDQPETTADLRRQSTELARVERRPTEIPLQRPSLRPESAGPRQFTAGQPKIAGPSPPSLARGLRPDLPASIPVRPELIGPAASTTPAPGSAGAAFEPGSIGPRKAAGNATVATIAPGLGEGLSGPGTSGPIAGADALAPRREIGSGPVQIGAGLASPDLLARSQTNRGIPLATVPTNATSLPIAGGGSGSAPGGPALGLPGTGGLGLDATSSGAGGRGYTPGGSGAGLGLRGGPGTAPGEGLGAGAGFGPGSHLGAGLGSGSGTGGLGLGGGLARSAASGPGDRPSLGGSASGSPLGRSAKGFPGGFGVGEVPIGPIGDSMSAGSQGGASSRSSGGDGPGSLDGNDDIGPQPHVASSLPAGIMGPGASGAERSGGPGAGPSLDAGIPSPRARPQSEVVHSGSGRLILEKTGGQADIDARVRDTAVEGLKQRDRQSRGAVAEARGGSAGSEQAVERGLDFLARHQSADGSWSLHDFAAGRAYENPGQAVMQSNTAGTGLALLSFLGAGYTHTDGKYRHVVAAGLGYLLAHQKPDGDLFLPQDQRSNQNVWLYSHGIASIALCEAYGMTREPRLRQPAQRALDFIVAAQSPDEGGWRYSPQHGSDTSVSGWQVMALKSGELSGLAVPALCYARLTHWLDHAQGAGGNPSRYAYRPNSTQAHQREPSRVMTAEALLMRQYLGWRRDNPNMIEGAEWLRENLPRYGQPTRSQPSGDRDAYYWYYATQVMFQMQGDYWREWNDHLQPLVLSSQITSGPLAGSWDPQQPIPDRWGYWGGRLYLTSMHLLMLEVYYRHLPIYQNLTPQR